jgi:histidine triad (HIT) family protein
MLIGALGMVADCIFCKIINGKIPSNFIAETDDLIVIKDIAPKAPTHYLIIPKKHVADVASLSDTDQKTAGNILLMARELSKDLLGVQSFRLVANNGAAAGQCVFHLHFHFLSGKDLPGF